MGGGQPLSDGLHHIDGDAVSGLLVKLGVGLERQDKVDALIRPSLEPQAFPWREAADAASVPHTGGFPLMAADPAVLLGGEAAGIIRQLRFLVHIHTAKGALAAPSGEGVGDFPAHPAAAGIEGGIGQIHTVAGICHFISLFRVFLDGNACAVQPGFPAHPACLGGQGAAYPFRGVDALPLCAGADLLKRRSCCFGERKYFSSAFFIKISDKVHPLAGLRDAEIFAVKHLPFHTIPQSIQRMEDGRKRPASVMVKQAGYVFKQQIRRSFCRSQPGNFKEQGTSWIGKSPTVSSNRKRLTGKTSAQEFEVGDIARIGFSDIFTEPLSFGIEQGFIALIGFFVDFAVSYTGKSSGTGESFPEPANTGEQVNISYGFLYHAPYLV